MKIAICLSGQPRTWNKCYPGWKAFEEKLCILTGAEKVDYFCHAWDFNTPPHAVLAAAPGVDDSSVDGYKTVKGIKLTEEEKQSFVDTINPIYHVFEDEEHSKSRVKEIRARAIPNQKHHGIVTLEWIASQFYSIMYASHLKQKYELENNFRYDIVFRMRYDLFLSDEQVGWFFNKRSNDFQIPKFNHIYSCHTRRDDNQFPFHRMGDIFWYGGTVAFDRICNLYRWLPILGTKSFGNGNPGTEHALYFYAKMLRMDIVPISIDPKIFRQTDYLDRKKQAGLEESLGGHELI